MSKKEKDQKVESFIRIKKGDFGKFKVGAWMVPFPPKDVKVEIEKIPMVYDPNLELLIDKLDKAMSQVIEKLDWLSYAMYEAYRLDMTQSWEHPTGGLFKKR